MNFTSLEDALMAIQMLREQRESITDHYIVAMVENKKLIQQIALLNEQITSLQTKSNSKTT